jgi:hypothetical protein
MYDNGVDPEGQGGMDGNDGGMDPNIIFRQMF